MSRYKIIAATTLLLSSLLYLVSFTPPDANDRSRIAAEIEFSIKNELLNKWYPQSFDKQYGGFISTYTFDFKPTGSQDKMIVTQARHTWSNARALEVFPEVAYYKTGARLGFKFLTDVMWDKTNGGFYTLVNRKGTVIPGGTSPKDAYGNAFAIYAMAAYYQATGDTNAITAAKTAFLWLEYNSHDSLYYGYFQHLSKEGKPLKRTRNTPSTSDLGYKDQNSSIHLLEAFSELYTVWPNNLVRQRLEEMLLLIRDKLINPKGYLNLFFKPDWTPISFKDSSEAVILKHSNLDHVSFGHDVETAYLMLEASHLLKIENDTATMRVSKSLIDHALKNGWDDKVGGFYDEGYYFKDKPGIKIIRDSKNWWAQAEGLNTLLLMADHFPNDEQQYFKKFQTQWNYIQHYLIDHEYGDWYQGGLDKEPKQKTALKGQIWKGNYHQLRAMINCMERLRPDTVAPSVPGNLHAVPSKANGYILQWNASKDNKQLLGYNIYENNKRTQFTPLNSLYIHEQKRSNTILIRAVDLQGNESGPSNSLTY
jgi:mannobiose 2-epimerase